MYGQNPFRRHPAQSPAAARPRCTLCPRVHAHSIRAWHMLHAMPSHPVTHSARVYKRRPHLLHLVRAIDLLSALVSWPPPPLFFVVVTAVDNKAHRLSVFLCRSSSFAELQSWSPKQWTATIPTGALLHSRYVGQLLLRRRPLSLVYFHGLHHATSSCRGPWTHLTRIFPPTVPRYMLCAPERRHARPGCRVSSDVRRPRATLRAMPGQAAPRRCWAT
jgi:hypothetical protein